MKLPAIRQLPSGSWFCRLRIDGRDMCITEPTRDLCKAKALAYKTGVLELRANPRKISLRDACDQYIKDREGIRSETTLEGYRWIVRNLFPGQMDKSIGDITEKTLSRAVQLERQRTTRLGKPTSPKTIKNAVASEGDISSALCASGSASAFFPRKAERACKPGSTSLSYTKDVCVWVAEIIIFSGSGPFGNPARLARTPFIKQGSTLSKSAEQKTT